MGQRHRRNFSPGLIATCGKFSLVRIVYTLNLKQDTWYLAIVPVLLQGIQIGHRRQRAVRQGFNSGHMKGVMYTKATGQQKTNSRGADDFGDGKQAGQPGREFVGFHPEGQM
jgi:hypothetical protein